MTAENIIVTGKLHTAIRRQWSRIVLSARLAAADDKMGVVDPQAFDRREARERQIGNSSATKKTAAATIHL